MSDDFHRPTLTFPGGAYNSTQVRLYGIEPSGGFVYPKNSISVGKELRVTVHTKSENSSGNSSFEELVAELRKDRDISDSEIFGQILGFFPPLPGFPFPFPIPKIPIGYATQLSIDVKGFGEIVISTAVYGKADPGTKPSSCGIMVGYSYEGHCYDLPKPKIMLVPTLPRPIPNDDCGYDLKRGDNYRLWIVDKLDECVEFEMNQGFVEQLVLEANLPGKRSPAMYASKAMMGHRSGKLND